MTEPDDFDPRSCATFERTFFRNETFWRVPPDRLADTPLARFYATFPDHAGDHNTTLYLVEHVGVAPPMFSVLLRCTHFEHTSLEDVRALSEFLSAARAVFAGDDGLSCGVELLDDTAEEIVLRFFHPTPQIRSLLQHYAELRVA